MGNKAREINSPVIKQLIDETTPEELAKIDAEMTNNKQQTAITSLIILIGGIIICIGVANSKVISIAVMAIPVLVFAYFCIYSTILRNKKQ
jgi:uncharacterized membrane protein